MSVVRRRTAAWLLLVGTALAGCAADENEDPGIGAGLRVNTVLGGVSEGYAKAVEPREFVFPDDHGPHPAYRSEWWYVTAVLVDDAGRDFGMQFTLFRQALNPTPTGSGPWHTAQAYLAHLAVTDVSAGEHLHAQRFSRGHPQLAGAQAAPFRAWIEDWRLEELAAEPFTVELGATAEDFGVALAFAQTQPLVLQGDAGLSHKGPGQASYYYSMPRLRTEGVLSLDGRDVAVRGWAWLDREWSTSVLGDHLKGWNWFALQLDDGRSLMAFSLTRKDGARDPYDHGLYVAPGGTGRRTLAASDYQLIPERFWQAPDGAAWPVAWRLRFNPGVEAVGGEEWLLEAMLDDQLMDVGLTYWEGIVAVRDAAGNRLGRGYMELTGY